MRHLSEFLYLLDMRKSYRTLAVSAVLGFGLGLSACSDSQVAGGGPSGSEAGNAITAQLLTADAKPATSAKIKIIDSESLDGAASARIVKADRNGNITIPDMPKGSYILEATQGDEALQMSIDYDGNKQELGLASLEKTVSVSGKVSESNGTIKIRGMDHSAPVVDGNFTINSLPAGAISLVFVPSGSIDTTMSYVAVEAGEQIEAKSFAEEKEALLLEDFQDSNYQHRFMLPHTYDGGWWYFTKEEDAVEAQNLTKDGLISLDKEENGNIAAHVQMVINNGGWALIGVELGKSDKKLCNDISSVESISFRARGAASLVFKVVHIPDRDSTEEYREDIIFQSEFSPSDDWRTFTMPIAEHVQPGTSLTCATQIAWLFNYVKPVNGEDTPVSELWLDDIKLIGGDRQQIWAH